MCDAREEGWIAPAGATATLEEHNVTRREFNLSERLDGPCTFVEWEAAARQLARLNWWTRAYAPAITLVEHVVQQRGVGYAPLHVVDVGCGSGDMLRALHRWAARRSIALQLTGIDLNHYAARAARAADRRESIAAKTITWTTGDVFTTELTQPPDVILSSLVAHHLCDADIVRLLRWQQQQARWAWQISDLRRSERAQTVFAKASRWLRLHPFLQHDGPVSFRRALSPTEWQQRLVEADLAPADVHVSEAPFARTLLQWVKTPLAP